MPAGISAEIIQTNVMQADDITDKFTVTTSNLFSENCTIAYDDDINKTLSSLIPQIGADNTNTDYKNKFIIQIHDIAKEENNPNG